MAFEFKEGNNKMLLYQTELKKITIKIDPVNYINRFKNKNKTFPIF